MNDQQRDLNDLYYFVQVVEHGGFAPAGRALNMPKSKLSRRVALLEARLGMRLIQRSTRRFTVTDVGQTYYAHCRAMLVEADAADEAIALLHEEPRGIVRVSCPVALLDSLAGAMIAAFMVACPHVEIHLEATNRRVDVVGEGIDVAIRVRPPPLEDSDLALRVLAERGQCLVASPALLREHGAPAVPADLTRMPSLDHGLPQAAHVWRLRGPDQAHAEIHHQPRLVTGGMLALRAAAVAGIGVVQLPTMMVRDELARGELVNVLPDWAPRREIVHAVFASRRGLLPGVRALLDFLAARFAELEPD
ncbi:LysR family transcriptional regulator [Burkholderia vietnamiensis]|jgi:DNA-binding transcriptional LysR family regulator|uniref:LysR family transcriptional regulator n=1 Tax=Burkholderia vietnamiensis TaxID=60552 RepID=UPI001041613D|nr:LysR family transcriptional regulator [Burkholderia vietnamiensis]MBR8281824.1 LysR family transcriptional regulator [Burkholderia vietnamiensis]MCA8193925.1 LysR family transcriptional regulator [Burkholderia vietnamiensis]MDN7409563.1 LysR family transcriptional regulator [Burkholderia vietnamiensis]QTK85469.1 LysR family transcriptional regulator [Burkholderia vietnamiensis]WHU91353.1 LysR family transcriptional regulator [Burkholderia vietnamiensis]